MDHSVQNKRLEKCKNFFTENRPFIALIVLLTFCMISNEYFRSPQNLINITRQVACSGIAALGMTFVIIAGGIDLSVGSLLAVAGVAGVMGMNEIASPVPAVLAAFFIPLIIGIIGGAFNGFLITIGKIPSFIATLGTLSIYRSLSLYFANAGTVSSSNEIFREVGNCVFLGIPLPTWVFIFLAFIFAILLKHTSFGRHVCAIGSNVSAAKYAAIKVRFVTFMTYVLAGFCSGIAAFLFSSRLNSISSTNAGLSYELDAIAAAIIGGTAMSGGKGSIAGTVAGVFILGIISNALVMWNAPVNLQGLVKGAVIIIAVLIQTRRTKN
ncbi:MAG: ABC transporter permease [Lentisphaeria bacterium]|nr:ABC transporter permease [Lentisphaeria bacterium]